MGSQCPIIEVGLGCSIPDNVRGRVALIPIFCTNDGMGHQRDLVAAGAQSLKINIVNYRLILVTLAYGGRPTPGQEAGDMPMQTRSGPTYIRETYELHGHTASYPKL